MNCPCSSIAPENKLQPTLGNAPLADGCKTAEDLCMFCRWKKPSHVGFACVFRLTAPVPTIFRKLAKLGQTTLVLREPGLSLSKSAAFAPPADSSTREAVDERRILESSINRKLSVCELPAIPALWIWKGTSYEFPTVSAQQSFTRISKIQISASIVSEEPDYKSHGKEVQTPQPHLPDISRSQIGDCLSVFSKDPRTQAHTHMIQL